MKLALVLLLSLLASAGCVASLPLDDRPCPCATGWTCDTRTQTCVHAPPDAGPDGSSGGMDGSSGSMDGHPDGPGDTTPPEVMILDAPVDPTNASTATFGFSSPDLSATFACDLDGAGYAPCSSPHALPALPDGEHTFTVRATDTAGNPGFVHRTWTIDTVAPSAAIITGPGALSSVTRPTFVFGSDDATAVFTCDLDGTGFVPCSSPDTLPMLFDGEHTLTVCASDAAGNLGFDHRTWTIDTQPPVVMITSGPGNATGQAVQTLEFTITGATDVECRVDAGPFAPCSSPFSTPPLSDGGHTITVRARDDAGNSASQDRPFIVDTVPPVVHVVPVSSPTGVSPVITFLATGAALGTIECQVDDGPFARCASPFLPPPIDNGSHTITVRASDDAGNTASDATAFTVSAPAYRHTIQIDGVRDFFGGVLTGELIDTTSNRSGFFAYATWDADFVYLAYETGLIGEAADPTRSFVIYLDADPGAATGSAAAEPFGTQAATFPAGFRADYALRWTADGALNLKQFDGSAWQAVPATDVVAASTAGYVEIALPLARIGSPPRIGLLGLWQLSGGFAELTLAGWYTDSFVDGDHRAANPAAIGHWLSADFASALPPGAPACKR